jgi:hypothetical protein
MKITLKKVIKGIIPYGIIRLVLNKQFENNEIIEYKQSKINEVIENKQFESYEVIENEQLESGEVIENEQLESGEVVEPRGGRSPDNSPIPPPSNIIPESMFHDYTLNGKMKVLYTFFDSRVLDNKRQYNSREKYDSVFRQLQDETFHYYGNEGQALLEALNNYPVNGKDIIIWGLAGCNCEAVAVWKGANNVYVVDYNKPICDHEKIEVMNHEELIQKEIAADFAISYSSFEHDGLGRYGDPLSPNGDFRAVREAHKFLTDNGILFLGVPLGEDCIIWNAHRIYGKYRLPLLLKGWQLLDVFDNNSMNSPEYPFDLPLGNYIQNVMVLRKIKNEFPDDEYLLGKNVNSEKINMVYERINKIIYDFKRKLYG